ncbi:MAG TPA: 3-hydroxyacyl-CoA dehydrogenase NAD-binding domain-containing protein [Pirellulales bacterium]|jgi:3-hydroxyacyl-CoA dehydrogenase/enoyl-CoA hydratase/carnithine racemase|nr:3-hydroxyacyl-CoA dehydrogenase NAD-binding domain-containing protein [Pirellulales bacterium]
MADSSYMKLTFPEPDIAVLTLDDPRGSANVLSQAVLEELEGHLNALESRKDLAGLVIRSGKPGVFIVGADIREFLAGIGAPREQIEAMCARGRKLFARLSQLPFVTVTAIEGQCVGGGAELALWCDRRVMSTDSKAMFGFPEVKLGLLPGWGGTVRSPRVVGLANGIELVTSGESIDVDAANAMGLISDRVPSEKLLPAAIAVIRAEQTTRNWKHDRKRWSGPIDISETELGFLGATASALIQQQTAGQYPAPQAALELMLEQAGADAETAGAAESRAMASLFGTPVNRALINVFFLTDRNKKDTGIDRKDVKAAPIKSVGVIGAGIMGQGIAAATLKRNIPVTLADAVPDMLTKGLQQTLEEVAYDKTKKAPDAGKAVRFAGLLNPATADAELVACDLVIEAIVENPEVKKQLYARLEPQLPAKAILASNTSTIPITKLAEGLKRPDQFCGIHFFNPVRKMPLVEVIRGAKTSDETVATAVAYAKNIGKSPIVVNDGPGFLVNRLLAPYLNEALELVSDGAEFKSIERAAKDFGMPMGPLTLYDVIGLDTAFYAGRVMYDAFPDRTGASPILPALVKAGRLGQKNGLGFFAYKDKSGRGTPDPAVAKLIEPYIRKREKFTAEQVTARLFLPMVLEATRILEAKVVRDPRDVDLGLIFGVGFPPFKGGLLFWADTLGAAKVVELLSGLEGLGPRFQPTSMLVEMAKSGGKFYPRG